jgi:hypothetical protein
MMTLSQRAALIKNQDPINRVEVLLGEPVWTISYTNEQNFFVQECYYAISNDTVLTIRYVSAISFFNSLLRNGHYDRFPSLLAKDEHRYQALRSEAIQNGYADWIVAFMVLVERGQRHPEALFAQGAFKSMDEGRKETFDIDAILAPEPVERPR